MQELRRRPSQHNSLRSTRCCTETVPLQRIFLRGHIMSSHNQRSPTQYNADGQQMNWKTTLRIASVMAEANERLFRVQSEAANAAFTENTKHLKALLNTLNTKDSSVLLAEWTDLYQANMRRIL